jgi:hypothetical protein
MRDKKDNFAIKYRYYVVPICAFIQMSLAYQCYLQEKYWMMSFDILAVLVLLVSFLTYECGRIMNDG